MNKTLAKYLGILFLAVFFLYAGMTSFQLTEKVKRLEHKVFTLESASFSQSEKPSVEYARWDDVKALNSGAHHKIEELQFDIKVLQLQQPKADFTEDNEVQLVIENMPTNLRQGNRLKNDLEQYANQAGFKLLPESRFKLVVVLPDDMETYLSRIIQDYSEEMNGEWTFKVTDENGLCKAFLPTIFMSPDVLAGETDIELYSEEYDELESFSGFIKSSVNLLYYKLNQKI